MIVPRVQPSGRQSLALSALAAIMLAVSLAAGPVAAQEAGAPPPPAVTAVSVERRTVAEQFEFIGRVEAVQTVELRARVAGYLMEPTFQEGDTVTEGTVLFRIEPFEFEANLQTAQAELLRAEARLREAEADLERAENLLARGNISEAQTDEARTARDSARADVLSGQSAVRRAELDLGYTEIEAPISGRIGRALITRGNFVSAESGPLARIVQVDPIRVVFSPTDRDILAAREMLGVDTIEELNRSFRPTLRLADGSRYGLPGVIEFSDNVISAETGTLAVWAQFPNPNEILLPGSVVSVISRSTQPTQSIVVPQAAVQTDRRGQFVLVLGADNIVEQRQITVGPTLQSFYTVEGGLDEGDLVVVEGLQRALPGSAVAPTVIDIDDWPEAG